MKKRMLVVFLVLGLCFCLVGCGKESEDAGKKDKAESAKTEQTKEPEATASAEAEEPEATPAEVTSTTLASTWEKLGEQTLDFPSNMAGYNNKDMVLSVGYAGEIHYSNDGGKTWDESKNSSMCRFGMDFLDDKICYTCGNGGDITKSTDGCQNFEKKENIGNVEPNQCSMMSFVDEKTGVSASKMAMGLTTDGADSWTKLTLPAGIEIMGVRMVDASTIYFVGSDFSVYQSTDAGKTWNATPMNLPDKINYYVGAQKFTINVDSEGAFTVCAISGATKKLVSFTTTDNWATCTQNTMPEMDEMKVDAKLFTNRTGDIISVFQSTAKTVMAFAKAG